MLTLLASLLFLPLASAYLLVVLIALVFAVLERMHPDFDPHSTRAFGKNSQTVLGKAP